jgi:hypothetical protein
VLLIAPTRTEYWTKVAVLGALALVCLGRGLLLRLAPVLPIRRRTLALAAAGAVLLYVAGLVAAGIPARPAGATDSASSYAGPLPPLTILPSKGVDSKLAERSAKRIERDLMSSLKPARTPVQRVFLWLESGTQGGSTPVARLEPGGKMVELAYEHGRYAVGRVRARGG